ncbi:MAG: hypothetical protein OXN25_09440 [Candidatus Poribacteria bacterium]|nr:hypothetical protein [Candidatus Poribacteria bacterium]MYK20101.1 hypothetical protein [Candidatus Poribacteria bacterium]
MKVYHTLFVSLLCLSFFLLFFGCAETDNPMANETETYASLFPLEENISPSDYPDGWVKLTDKDIEKLLNLEILPNWHNMDISQEWQQKYNHATLFKQFGDIPEVRYIIEFQRNPGFEISHQLYVAYFEAHYRLFPNENNRRALEEAWNIPNQPGPETVDEGKLREEDPELYIKIQKERFIKNHGDIPQVHIYIDFLRKVLLRIRITDAERLAALEAYFFLFPTEENRIKLEEFRKALGDEDVDNEE